MDRIEREGEQKLMNILRARGLKVHHMDTTVDGFPDLLVMGKKIILIEMKKQYKPSTLLRRIMEPSQPTFMYESRASGYNDIYLCIYQGKNSYDLYRTSGILELAMGNGRLNDMILELAMASDSDIASYILAKMEE